MLEKIVKRVFMAAVLLSNLNAQPSTASAAPSFEGRIQATVSRGGEPTPLLYTIGTNFLRIEVSATNYPHPVDIIDRFSGGLTLLFPHNRSFVRFKPTPENPSASPPAMLMPLPAGIGPQSVAAPSPASAVPGMSNLPAISTTPALPAMPTLPAMPRMPMEELELKATGHKTNLLGYSCEHFEIKQRGETLDIWATQQLFPFEPYRRQQPPRFAPRHLEEQWPGLLRQRRLFPLRASLHYDNGAERFRFEVQSIQSQKLTESEANLFHPPLDYQEVQPLPF